MPLSDKRIRERVGMIEPFSEAMERPGTISYGVTSYGYDIRLGTKFSVIDDTKAGLINPKKFDRSLFRDFESIAPVVIPGKSFALGVSLEKLKIPRDVVAIVIGKSTYARCGLIVNVTPLEPEWEGDITMELSNTTPNPLVVFPMEGIAQVMFFCEEFIQDICEQSYADKKGKYQNQLGLQIPIVK